jgi:hypothetical protein
MSASLLETIDTVTVEEWVNTTLNTYLSSNIEVDSSETTRIFSWTTDTLAQLEVEAKSLDNTLANETTQLTTQLIPSLQTRMAELRRQARGVEADTLQAIKSSQTVEKQT